MGQKNEHSNEIDKTKIRSLTIPLFHRLLYTKTSKNKINKALISMHKAILQFHKKSSNVMFTRADKDNVTVALERQDYIIAMEKLLHDKNTYTIVKKNPKKRRKKFKLYNKSLAQK